MYSQNKLLQTNLWKEQQKTEKEMGEVIQA